MMILRGVVRKALSVGVAAAFATMLALALTPSGAVAAACALSIPTCGCTINSPGTYTLTGTSPMDSTGTCINITASNVILTASSVVIKGPGSTSSTFGVHIESTANRALMEGIEAEDFGQGVRVDGPNASLIGVETGGNNKGVVVNGANAYLIETISEFDNLVGIQVNPTATDFVMVIGGAEGATGAGVELNGVNGAFMEEAEALGNGTFGIWLKSASDNFIAGFESESNGIAAVYLGCNAAGPNGTACAAGVPSSNGNSLMGSVYGTSTNSIVSNTGTPFDQRFGIAVGLGNLHNHFLLITGAGNVDKDALDENPTCGNDRWFADTFTTSSPAKNTTSFCLN